MTGMEGYTNVTGKNTCGTDDGTFDEDDSEPLYDSVPSEGDYDECNEAIVVLNRQNLAHLRQLGSKTLPEQVEQGQRASSTTLITSLSSNSQEKANYVSQSEYALLKEQMLKSATLMEQFFAENREMRGEMARLQATVERLVEENAQLRGQQQQMSRNSFTNQNNHHINHNSSSSTSLNFIEQQQQLQRNSFLRASGSRVRPQSTATTNSYGNTNNNTSSSNSIPSGVIPPVNRYSSECINSLKTPPTAHSNQSSNSSLLNYQAQQTSFPAPPPLPPSNNQNQHSFVASSAHSSSSSLSSSQIPSLQHQQQQSSTNQQHNLLQLQQQQQSMPYLGCSVAAAVEQLNAAHQQLHNNPGAFSQPTSTPTAFPSKEDVIKKIEFITNSIKELLSNAREGKHDE